VHHLLGGTEVAIETQEGQIGDLGHVESRVMTIIHSRSIIPLCPLQMAVVYSKVHSPVRLAEHCRPRRPFNELAGD
jgi:hypothetical protein